MEFNNFFWLILYMFQMFHNKKDLLFFPLCFIFKSQISLLKSEGKKLGRENLLGSEPETG